MTAHLSARIVAPSAAVGEAYADRWRLSPDRVVVLANPVPPRHPAPGARERVRSELQMGDGETLVLCLARLERQKGVDVLIEAARSLPATVRIVVAGDGPEHDALLDPATAAGVQLLGHRRDVADLLAAADLLCLPSRHEALPLALLEAMQAGVPVVASAVGGIPELLARGAGVLVAPGAATALGTAIGELVADPARRRRLAADGAVRVAARHAPAVVAQAHFAVYRSLLRDGRPGVISGPGTSGSRTVHA